MSFIPQLLCSSQSFLTQLFYKSTRIYLHPIYLSWGQDSRIGTAVGSLESVANLRLFRSDKKSNQPFQLSRGSRTGKKTSTTQNFERDTVRRICSPKNWLKHCSCWFGWILFQMLPWETRGKSKHLEMLVLLFPYSTRVRVAKSRSFKDSTIGTT